MDSIPRRVLWLIVLFDAGAFVFFFIQGALDFQSKAVLPAYYWHWIWNRAALDFIQAMIPVQCTAILVGYSAAPAAGRRRTRAASGDGMAPFYRLVSSSLVAFLVFTLLFAGLAEGVRPVLNANRDTILYQTQLARRFYADYESAYGRGQLAEARYYLDFYRRLAPSDQNARDKSDQLIIQIEQQRPRSTPTRPAQEGPIRNASVARLIDLARGYLTRQDFASARYYATLASEVDPANKEAALVAREALAGLSRITPNQADRERGYYFAIKSKGREALEEGDPKTAYYIFKSLAVSHPDDPDVVTYLKRSTEQLAQFSFFRDEIDRTVPFPGVRNVVFMNRADGGSREILSIKKMVILPEGTYFEGIEALGLSPGGSVTYHLIAPYGKLMGSKINMDCIGRDKAVNYLPSLLSGSLPGGSSYELPLGAPAANLGLFGTERTDFTHVALPELWNAGNLLQKFGYLKAPVQIEILRRILSPFGMLILSITAIGLGWSLRAPSGRPRIAAYVLVPFFPFVVYLITEFYFFVSKLLFGFALITFGQGIALVALLAVQFVLLFLALVYVAGQSGEMLSA